MNMFESVCWICTYAWAVGENDTNKKDNTINYNGVITVKYNAVECQNNCNIIH